MTTYFESNCFWQERNECATHSVAYIIQAVIVSHFKLLTAAVIVQPPSTCHSKPWLTIGCHTPPFLPFWWETTLGYVSLYSTSECHCWPLKNTPSRVSCSPALELNNILESFQVSGYRWQLLQLNCVHNFKFGFTSKVHNNHFTWELSVTTFKWAYCNHGVLLPPHTPLCLVRWVWLGWCGRRYVNSSSVGHC